MKKVASFSGGKDSTAMVLRLIEEGKELDEVVFYDTGAEFPAVYAVVGKVADVCMDNGVKFTTIRPARPFFFDMLVHPVNFGKESQHAGYGWCGGCTRWGTSNKTRAIDEYFSDDLQYVGIAADEAERAKGKAYPLIEWGMTERDCLSYCRSRGISWEQDGVDLYDVLDRVSCWCCGNKNEHELRNIYHKLSYWWECLKSLQIYIAKPFKSNGMTILDYEEKFKREDEEKDKQGVLDFGI